MRATQPLRLLALTLALGAPLLAAPARAEDPPKADAKPAAPAPAVDPATKALGERVDALAKQAAVLVEEYKRALSTRVDQLASENPTLKRLKGAGVFSLQGLLAGIADEPLAGLGDIRRVYEGIDKTAQDYVMQFGGVAKSRAEAAAVEYLKKIAKAQSSFREDDKDGNGTLDYATTFYELGQTRVLEVPKLKKGDNEVIVEGYRFKIMAADIHHFVVLGAPAQQGGGEYYLYVDETNVVRAEKGGVAGPTSPKYEPEKDPKK